MVKGGQQHVSNWAIALIVVGAANAVGFGALGFICCAKQCHREAANKAKSVTKGSSLLVDETDGKSKALSLGYYRSRTLAALTTRYIASVAQPTCS